MSLLVKRIAFFFSALVVFFACEDPTNIGEELEPQNQNFGVLFADTFTIRTSTVLIDSVRTSQSPYFLVGNYDDSKLGRVTAQSFLQARLNDAYSLGDNPQLESLQLILDYAYAYGDTNQVQELQVYRLTDSIRIYKDDKINAKTYYNFDRITYDASTPVGMATFQPRPYTPGDSLIIRLSDDLGQYLLSLNGNNADQFQQNFFGLTLAPGPATSNAVITGFTAATAFESLLRLNYRNAAGEARYYDFPVTRLWFNTIQSDRSNTPVAGLVNFYDALPSAATSEETYVQGGVGLMTKIEIPTLKALLDSDSGDATVNRVELLVEPAVGSVSAYAPAAPGLALYRADPQTGQLVRRSGFIIPLPRGFDPNPGPNSSPQLVGYDNTSNAYRFDITPVVQTYLFEQKKLSVEQRTSLAAYLTIPSASINTLYQQELVPASVSLEDTPNRLVIRSQANGANSIKLRVYYTRRK